MDRMAPDDPTSSARAVRDKVTNQVPKTNGYFRACHSNVTIFIWWIYYLLHIIDEVKSSYFNLNICITNICVLSTSPQNLFEKRSGDFRPFLGYFPIQMYNHNTANYILACFSQDVPNRLCGPATCLCLVCRCIMLRALLPFNLPVEWAYGWSTTIKPAS